MDNNGSKYITWRATGIIISITGVIISGIFLVAQSAYSTSQDNRVELSGIQATLQSIDSTLIRYEKRLPYAL